MKTRTIVFVSRWGWKYIEKITKRFQAQCARAKGQGCECEYIYNIYAFCFYWKKWERWCVILSLTSHSRTMRGMCDYLCLKLYSTWQVFQFLRRRMNPMRKSANICILLLHSKLAFERNETDDFKPNLPPADNAGRVWPILVCSLSYCCWQSQENWPNYRKWFVISLAIREQLKTNFGQSRTNEYKFLTWQNGLIMEPHCTMGKLKKIAESGQLWGRFSPQFFAKNT